ncbi:HAD family hydrolase [Vibrio syngnathi]|uniref:Pyrimidine 5'-nucleotidase YjjG n=1 Tax=Vibrio syngnathi TaxID=3034029 RepID=A0AA34TRC2_9VIBR|nr:HAD family hydrolase [Vibrio syngnathi]ARP39452.1 Pyrimidine 5'-nucleotidase YjjG [Vibrio syngnathi]
MSVKGILLDLDDTLYKYEETHQVALNTALELIHNKHAIDMQSVVEAFNFAKQKLKSILPNVAANHSRILYFQLMLEHLQIKPIPHAYDVSHVYWDVFLNNMILTEDATQFLDKYKDIPICLLTDLTAEIQYRKIEKLGLTKSIDFIVTSEEAGVEKPHPFMFKRALTKLKLSTDEVIMIGDNYKKDIVGANLLGIKSFWINRNGKGSSGISNCCTEVKSLAQVNFK